MGAGDGSGYRYPVPGRRQISADHSGAGDHDKPGDRGPAGYGYHRGGSGHGPGTGAPAAGDGEWEALRHGILGRSGGKRRDKHRRGRRVNGDQQPDIQQIAPTVHKVRTKCHRSKSPKERCEFCKKVLDKREVVC